MASNKLQNKELRNRKRVRIKCAFQSMSGNTYNGTTRSLSLDSAFIECLPLTGPVITRPKINDMGMIKLFIMVDENPVSLNCRCRIINVFADGLDLDAQFAYMTKTDLGYLEKLIQTA